MEPEPDKPDPIDYFWIITVRGPVRGALWYNPLMVFTRQGVITDTTANQTREQIFLYLKDKITKELGFTGPALVLFFTLDRNVMPGTVPK